MKTFMRRTLLTLMLSSCITTHVVAKNLIFTPVCAPNSALRIAFVGDILLHKPLQLKGINQSFEALWHAALPYLKNADLTFGNLEGPMGGALYPNGKPAPHPDAHGVYTGYPLFNYPDTLAPALVNSGFDIVSIANNHTLDRQSQGLDHTIEVLNHNNLIGIGAKHSSGPHSWSRIIEKNQIKIGWIACAEHTNGMPDKHNQVLSCFQNPDKEWIFNEIKRLKSEVDAILILPHWGQQYHVTPTRMQQNYATKWLEAGASAVIGTHPHVLQPAIKYNTQDGRETLIVYSLGNFVSNQGSLKNRSSVILLVEFAKKNQQVFIQSLNYVPIYMQNRRGLKAKAIELEVLKTPNTIIKQFYPLDLQHREDRENSKPCLNPP